MNEIEIKLFGAFRKYVPSGCIKVQLPDQFTGIQAKEIVDSLLQQQVPTFIGSNLVFESALATESEVLADDQLIRGRCNLALLPPVCGG